MISGLVGFAALIAVLAIVVSPWVALALGGGAVLIALLVWLEGRAERKAADRA
ncbi:MAG TPA: hypothetical protein VMS60_15755 [Solirubrobacterales bacterium]|nr:hypothetical protein [Solirubrobacterales bacterium]